MSYVAFIYFLHKMHVQNIFLAFLPLGQASMRTRRSAFTLFGYVNEKLQLANQKRLCVHVTLKDRLGGGVKRGA